KWAGRFVSGDMGDSYTSTGSSPVSDKVKSAAPVSGLIILYTQIVALAISIPLAIVAAYRNNTWIDRLISTVAFGALSLPGFAVALILSYIFGVKLGWVKVNGWNPPSDGLITHFKSVAVPVIALALAQIAVYLRLLRSD